MMAENPMLEVYMTCVMYIHVNTLLFEGMVASWLVCLTLHVDVGVNPRQEHCQEQFLNSSCLRNYSQSATVYGQI